MPLVDDFLQILDVRFRLVHNLNHQDPFQNFRRSDRQFHLLRIRPFFVYVYSSELLMELVSAQDFSCFMGDSQAVSEDFSNQAQVKIV